MEQQQQVSNEESSLEKVKVQEKLAKVGKFEVVENPRFMVEARQKELERGKERQMQSLLRGELMPN